MGCHMARSYRVQCVAERRSGRTAPENVREVHRRASGDQGRWASGGLSWLSLTSAGWRKAAGWELSMMRGQKYSYYNALRYNS
jgi:hypothetical protein